jgi:polar amino acid transport system substrate-binding protein
MKKFVKLIAVMLLACLCLTACGSADGDIATIEKNGKIVVGITEYAPMDYLDENGEWTGFDAEFARAVAAELGVEAEFIEIDWDNKFFELESGAIDCVWNGMTITDEALKNASVSDPYVENAQVVVMDKSKLADFPDAASMADLTFAAEASSAGEMAIADVIGAANCTSVLTQTDALLEVASGSADACVIDITMANAMTGEGTSYSDLAYSLALTSEEYGVAFRKESDVTAKFNDFMAKCIADGTLQALADKYSLTLAG